MSDKLTELLKELGQANATLKDCDKAESAARSQSCEAKNRVNRLQKEIDAEMKKIKETAERDTNWGSERRGTGCSTVT